MNLRGDTRSKAVSPTRVCHVTPTLNPSPRGRDLTSPSRGPSSKLRKLLNLLNFSVNIHFTFLRKSSIVFSIRQVIVIGPTPPGTGVITDASGSTAS